MAVCIALLLSGYWYKTRKTIVRYRVTVVIDDHGVERHGSAVWSQSLWRPIIQFPDNTLKGNNIADAIPIRLGDGSIFFVLLQSWDPQSPSSARTNPSLDSGRIPYLLFHRYAAYKGSDLIQSIKSINASRIRGGNLLCPSSGKLNRRTIKDSKIPIAVFCFNLALSKKPTKQSALTFFDPACAYFDPACPVRIKNVSVALTNAAANRPLSAVIPWLDAYDENRIYKEANFGRSDAAAVVFRMRRFQ